MQRYNPNDIEPKWQQKWAEDKIYEAKDDSGKPKRYVLEFFPYPSGAAMHVGHVRNYTIGDALTRHARMNGFEVLHPMGWDAFGLPAENYAIKTGISPQEAIAQNTARFRQQLTQMGFGYDWSREFASSDPDYYRWTQWFFELLYKRGLAYQKESLQWWCPVDKTVLANEQVENGQCWRCGSDVEKKALKQWFFKITDYADRLAADLDNVNWTGSIKHMQRNWIGRSKGTEIDFAVEDSSEKLRVFTTRADTLYGGTFMVVAPEHPIIMKITTDEHRERVGDYIKAAQAKSDVERQDTNREKTGVFTGAYAINPINNQKIPVWVADYVLYGYGTGAIMAVPAHDERDFAFAQKFELPVAAVVAPEFIDTVSPPREGEAFKERVAVQSIVKHPTEDKYLLLKLLQWQTPTFCLPMGGVDEDEDVVAAALRELAEETGYDDVQATRPVGRLYFAQFYHEGKKENRRAEIYTVALELKSLHQTDISAEEQAIQTAQWVSAEELRAKVSGEGCQQMVDAYFGQGTAFHGEGVMINSGEFTGLSTSEAREKIVKHLAKIGAGKERINYKIRDWLISRQRYWGAPIPIIHCAQCKQTVEAEANAINFYDETVWQQLASGRKSVETRADNPEEPERRFADIAEGAYLKMVNKKTDETIFARVVKAEKFASLEDLLSSKETVAAIFPENTPETLEALRKRYAFTGDYLDRIQQNGLVSWTIELVTPGIVPVPEADLPVKLPSIESYEPSGDGRSPLARVPEFVNTTCPTCGSPAERETDTMDGFACSSWYFLRFADPHNNVKPFDAAKVQRWLPVDQYIGGAEHAVMHLLYARMWTKVMQDAGLITFGEPFTTLLNQGMILAPDGQKMSKSKGNTIEPEVLIEQGYGADAIRVMELFIGPWNQKAAWSVEGLGGSFRFLQRVWTLTQEFVARESSNDDDDATALKQTMYGVIKKVSDDMQTLGFNTAIAAMMEAVNDLYKLKSTVGFAQATAAWQWALESLLQLLAPFAPHIVEELWAQLGHDSSIHLSDWPKYDEQFLVRETVTIVVQVNGKLRAALEVAAGAEETAIIEAAKASAKVAAALQGKVVRKTVFVPGKLVNFVV